MPLTVYKKCRTLEYVTTEWGEVRERDCIVVLSIPDDAWVHFTDGFGISHYMRAKNLKKHPLMETYAGKMRASRADVRRIERVEPSPKTGKPRLRPKNRRIGFAKYDETFVYLEGCPVKPKKPFARKRNSGACASGIHFFMTREQAVNYRL